MRPPLHSPCTFARLLDADRMPLCRRSMLGRILESKKISHIDVESARRACGSRRGWARARSARARLRPLCASAVLCASSSGAQVAHALCCRTFVSCRVPFGGFYIYIVYICVCSGLSADH